MMKHSSAEQSSAEIEKPGNAALTSNKLNNRALSSAGSERLPYKQRVGGSNPSAPTPTAKTVSSTHLKRSLLLCVRDALKPCAAQANACLSAVLLVATAAWQRCYGGMATLLRRRGNVVTGAWQRTVRYIVMKTKDGETKTRDGETTRKKHVAANGLRGKSAKRMAEELTGATARLHGPYASINHVAAS